MPQFKPTRIRKHKHRSKVDDGSSQRSPEIQARRDAEIQSMQLGVGPVSSKKKKRLEKYVDKKLHKEENLALLKKLAANKIDTSLFRSTKTAGTGKDTKRKALSRALARERAGIQTMEDTAMLYDQRKVKATPTDVGISDEFGSEPESDGSGDTPEATQSNVKASTLRIGNGALGSGLKRPLSVDDTGNPIIKKRQRTNKRYLEKMQEELVWEGFSSESEVHSDDESVSNNLSRNTIIPQTEKDPTDTTSASEDSDELDGSDSASDDSEFLSDISQSDYAAIFSTVAKMKSGRDNKSESDASRRGADFKTWAAEQINEARDFAPSQNLSNIEALARSSQPKSIAPRAPDVDPLPKELLSRNVGENRKAFSVQVDRSEGIQESRLKLPIVAEEQKIMEAIHNNPVTIVCGATGSGKTTQVPQFLYEAGYGSAEGPTPGMIAVTQPRRVAAVTMAKRVGEELGATPTRVGYQIRFDSTVGGNTAIKFMTDGILIREIAKDFTLRKYSAVIIDEAHERSVNTDILIGMLSRIVSLRADLHKEDSATKPLKLIVMSATISVDSFLHNEHLFKTGQPPLVESEGRQYPVTMHFARRTQRDYVDEMFKKVSRGHRKLPSGGFLVFLTGQSEIAALWKRLNQNYSLKQPPQSGAKVSYSAKDVPLETEDIDVGDDQLADDYVSDDDDSSGDSDIHEEEEDKEFDIDKDNANTSAHPNKLLVLPLYSQLPTKEQLKVFEAPPEGTRMVILATNVAETSITIPGIKYVFDCGRVKERRYDKETGVQSYEIGWISKASAAQRAGRAGRTAPGHCYRLYSSAIYERDFEEHTTPEILKAPVEGVVLQLKSMHLHHVVNFPFPTPPDRRDIARAESLLSYLGALDKQKKITEIGQSLSLYPISPRFAKLLVIGHQKGCMYLTTALVAALAISELFIPENQLDLTPKVVDENEIYTQQDRIEDDHREKRRKAYNEAHSIFSQHDRHADAVKLMAALCGYAWAQQKGISEAESYCRDMFIREKAASEAFQLYQQLLYLVSTNHPNLVDPSKVQLDQPSATQVAALKQIVAAGFLDQVAIRADLAPLPPEIPRRPKRAIDVPYLTLFPSSTSSTGSDAAATLEDTAVFVSPSSVLARLSPTEMPPYLVYARLQKGQAPHVNSTAAAPKTRMHPLAPITARQLFGLAKSTPLVEYGKPIGKMELVPGALNARTAWVVPSLVGVRGRRDRAWPLPAVKVLQRNDGKGWEVDKVLG